MPRELSVGLPFTYQNPETTNSLAYLGYFARRSKSRVVKSKPTYGESMTTPVAVYSGSASLAVCTI